MARYADIAGRLAQGLKPVYAVGEADAAVAVLLQRAEIQVQVLLVQRRVRRSDPWSGQMAFPGGKRDPDDLDIMHTLVRETREETSINLAHGCRVLGALEITRSTVRPALRVAPFVILLKTAPAIVLNDELEGYMWVSLAKLEKSETMADLPMGTVPAYIVNGHAVWGLTYHILQMLFRV